MLRQQNWWNNNWSLVTLVVSYLSPTKPLCLVMPCDVRSSSSTGMMEISEAKATNVNVDKVVMEEKPNIISIVFIFVFWVFTFHLFLFGKTKYCLFIVPGSVVLCWDGKVRMTVCMTEATLVHDVTRGRLNVTIQ